MSLCTVCKKVESENGYKTCNECRNKLKEYKSRLRNKRILNRECVKCGNKLSDDEYRSYCSECAEKHSQYNKKRAERYKKLNKCLECGGDRGDSTNSRYCRACVEKEMESRRKSKQFYISLSICPKCKKEAIFGDEKMCPECKADIYKYNRSYIKKRKENGFADADKQKELEAKKKRYYRHKEQGICVECGKSPAKAGRVRCCACLIKNAEKSRNRHYEKVKNKEIPDRFAYRKENGLCLVCEKPVYKKFSFCKECYDKKCESLKKGRENQSKDVNLRFFRNYARRSRENEAKNIV